MDSRATPSLSIIERNLADFSGLEPRAWICVAPGYGREELKAVFFERGFSLGSESTVNLETLARRVLGLRPERVLAGPGRQEVLRLLLADRRILTHTPELRRLKRQSGFFKKLDRALQSGRMAFAHENEREVQEQRISEKLGENPARTEVSLIAAAYEAWLDGQQLWDSPRLLRTAVVRMDEAAPAAFPEKVYRLGVQQPEPLERAFWDSLSRHVAVEEIGLQAGISAAAAAESGAKLSWERWHTLDDGAEGLAERLAAIPAEKWADHTILIPDMPAIRRSVRRALESHGVALSDPRDPMRLRSEETIKRAVLPLEVVASRFERRQVISYIQLNPDAATGEWVKEIHARGVRQGLDLYMGGKLTHLHQDLTRLQRRFGVRLTVQELTTQWTRELELAKWLSENEKRWLLPWIDRLTTELKEDLERVGIAGRSAPILLWMERLNERIDQAAPPIERSKPRNGVILSRLGQAPLRGTKHLHLIGMSVNWISSEGIGDLWYPDRERELLGSEFSIRCSQSVRADRIAVMKAWRNATSEQIGIIDSRYDWDGRERESMTPLLRELGWSVEPAEKGAYTRFIPSFNAIRPAPPSRVKLRPLIETGKNRVSVTALDDMSKCAFIGLAKGRWKLYDLREAEPELWGDVRGRILHAAIHSLLLARDDQGNFSLSVEEALEQAWQKEKPQGLLQGPRLVALAKKKMREVLEAFCRAEKIYVERSGTKISSLEGPPLHWKTDDGIEVVGIPDRIDEHPDGIFVLDYKSSSALPKGKQMVEQGYRLQLPYYAITAARELGKPAIGVQFIELNKKGGRGSGMFFAQWNGKTPGNLTATTKNSTSLLQQSPQDAWPKIEEHILSCVKAFTQGDYEARPKIASDCARCNYYDLCGRGRASPGGDETEASPEEGAS